MENETQKTEVKKRGSHSIKVECLKCGTSTPLNAYELCLPCRTKSCKDCSKPFQINKNLTDRCSECSQKRKKRLQRLGDS
jgi:hypothetical protein